MECGILGKVKGYIGRYRMIAPGDTVVAGVSGGADSVCLFFILCELAGEMGFRLAVVHVNHGIRQGDADADEAFVERLCRERGIPFTAVHEDVRAYAARERISEEEAGRKVRYRAFREALARYADGGADGFGKRISGGGFLAEDICGKGKIAVAHNANDRAETVLFHLFRGTGLAGMAGIRPVRGCVIRPILCLERGEIEEFLGERGISFCIDRTNMEDTYTRNRIRNHIFPYVEKEICQGAVRHLCGTAELLAETEGYVGRQAEAAYLRCLADGADVEPEAGTAESRGTVRMPELDADRLLAEDPFIRRQVLLLALEQVTEGRKDITSVHVGELERLLGKEGSKQISLPYGLVVRREPRREGARLVFCRKDGRKEDKKESRKENKNEGRKGSCAGTEGFPVPLQVPAVGTMEVPGLGEVAFTLLERGDLPPESGLSAFFLGKSQFIPQKSCTKWFDYDRITKSLLFRVRKTGDYLTMNQNGKLSRKKLKDYMIGEKIPRNQREEIYVLADGSHVLWVPGYRISEYYKVTGDTRRILQVQIRGGL